MYIYKQITGRFIKHIHGSHLQKNKKFVLTQGSS